MSSDAAREFAFSLPDPGEGLTEAEIVEWCHEEGDEVEEDEPLVDVETDKAVVEIPAPCTGTLETIRVEPGDVAAVGDVIAVFTTENPPRQQMPDRDAEPQTATGARDDGETKQAIRRRTPEESSAVEDDSRDGTEAPADAESGADGESDGQEGTGADGEEGAEKSGEAGSDGRVFAAPSTRRYAREQGVDLSAVSGSGPGGRVLRDDVDCHREAAVPAATADDGGSTSAIGDRESASTADDGEVLVEPLRGRRRTIAENVQRAAREIPHVTSGFEADATALVDLKERLNEKHDVGITYTAILVKAVVPALREFPLVNASIDVEAGEITKYRYYDVGVATHTKDGLLVPVVRRIGEKSLLEVAESLTETVEAAREGEIAPADLQGGTFTMTNTGSHGIHGTYGTPIIRHPEAAILGVGAIDERPVAVDGELTVRERIGFDFSYDHRLVDGVTASRFMERVIEGIEDPDLLLSRL